MPILVSDTSVIIDLERADLLTEIYRLTLEFALPDLLFVRELAGNLGNRLVALGLRIETLSSAELTRATQIMRARRALSVPDTFAFTLAHARQWALLTGDGELRDLAREENVEMHGVLWIFDQFAQGNLVGNMRLHTGLTTLRNHPRCRLPLGEIRKRLSQYVDED